LKRGNLNKQDTRYRIQDEKAKPYKDFEVCSLAKELVVQFLRLTVEELPTFEMYEEGSRIRRSSVSKIVGGFGRRRCKNEFIQFLTYAIASRDETKVHLKKL
jgi:four helix bundle protein